MPDLNRRRVRPTPALDRLERRELLVANPFWYIDQPLVSGASQPAEVSPESAADGPFVVLPHQAYGGIVNASARSGLAAGGEAVSGVEVSAEGVAIGGIGSTIGGVAAAAFLGSKDGGQVISSG